MIVYVVIATIIFGVVAYLFWCFRSRFNFKFVKYSSGLPFPSGQTLEKSLSSQEIEIVRIWRSTRTTFKKLLPLHNKLRARYPWYYRAHLNPRASRLFGGLSIVYIAIVFSVGTFILLRENPHQAKAFGMTCTAQATGNWNAGATWSSCGANGPVAADTVIINAAYTVTLTANAAASSVTVSAGTLAIGTYDLAVTGTSTVNGGAVTEGISATNGWTMTDFAISSGSVTCTGASIIKIAGNFSNSGGTFTAGSSTVVLNGAGGSTQTFTGSATFYNLIASTTAARTVKFTSGTTQNISNTFIMNGAASNLLTIAAVTGGSTATLNYTGTKRAQVVYTTLTDIVGTPASTWYYDANSSKNAASTGWTSGTKVRAYGATGGNFSAATNWIGGAKPIADDDVVFDVLSGSVVMDEATANVRSWEMGGYLGTLSSTGAINVVTTTAVTVNVRFGGTVTATGALTMNPGNTSSIINFTSAGKVLARVTSVTATGNGKVVQQDDFAPGTTFSNSSLAISGTAPWDMNNYKIIGNATTRFLITSITKGTTSVLTLNGGAAGSATQFQYANFRDILFNNGGADLNLSAITGLSGNCLGNGMSGGGVLTLTSSSPQTWTGQAGNYSDNNKWSNYLLNFDMELYTGVQDNGTTDTITSWTNSAGDGKIEATATVHGGSSATKLLSGASANTKLYQNIALVPGTAMTLTFWTRGDGTNDGKYQLYDVTNSANIIAVTSTGVTGLTYTQVSTTFTVPANCVVGQLIFLSPSANGGVGYFDDVYIGITATIGSQRSPLPQDDVYFRSFVGAGRVVNYDKREAGSNLDFTGLTNAANKPTFSASAGATNLSFYGNLTLVSTTYLTFTPTNFLISWEARSNCNLTTAGQDIGNITVAGTGATLQMQDDLTASLGGGVTLSSGTFDTQAFTSTVGSWGNGSGGNKEYKGSGAIIISGAVQNEFNINSGQMTWSHTGPISITYTGASAKNFYTGTVDSARTMTNNITISGGGAGTLTFQSNINATFTGTFKVTGGTKTLIFTAGVSYIFTDPTGFGNGTNVITVKSTSAGSVAIWHCPTGGNFQYDYLDITDIQVSNVVFNPGYEVAGAGGAGALYLSWFDNAGTGTISDETTLTHSGGHAVKLIRGSTDSAYIRINASYYMVVSPGQTYNYSFWSRGDGTNAGRYLIYDTTNAANIVASTGTGIPGTTYLQVTGSFTVPAGCLKVSLYFYPPNGNTQYAYFDDVSVTSTPIDNWYYGSNSTWHSGLGWNASSPPVNNSLTFSNPYSSNVAIADDTTVWQFQAKVTDPNGPTDMNYVMLRLANSADSASPYDSIRLKWTQSTGLFTEDADSQNAITVTSVGADGAAVGNQWTLNFKFRISDNFLNKNTSYAAELYSVNNGSLSDLDNYASFYQVSGLSLTLSVDNSTLSFGSLLPGSILTGTTVATVTTNYGNGYVLQISDGVSGSGSVLLHTDDTTRIADYAGTIATPTLWTDTGLGICVFAATGKDTSKWGTGVSEVDSANKYAGVPQAATTIHTKTGAPTSGDNTSIAYKLVVPNNQKTGNYSGILTYTAIGVLQ